MAEDLSFRVKNTLVVNGAFVANASVVNAAAINATSINTSSVNAAAINATSVNTATANATTSIVVGANVSITTSSYAVGNSTANTTITSTAASIGNTTSNTVINSTSLAVANSTTSTVLGTADIRVGNTSVNVVISNTVSSFGGNVTVTGAVTSSNVTASLFTGNVTGTSSNATNLNSQPGSFYTNATNITTGTLPDARLSSAVVNTSGNFTVAGNINFTAANVIFANVHVGANVDLTSTSLSVGNTTVNTVATAGQITLSGATINATNYSGTANNANNLGGTAASGYALLSGSTFTGPVIVSNTLSVSNSVTITGNLIVTGTTLYANVTNLDVKDLNITVAKGVASAAAADGAGLTVDVANVTWNYHNSTNSWQSNVNITPAANNSLSLGNVNLVWANLHVTNIYGTLQTTSQPNITANNSTNFAGLSLATVQSQITGNAATAYSNAVANAAALYQTTAGLSANVATLTSNNSTNFGGLSLATVQGQITGNAATAYSNAVAIAANATNLTTGAVPAARLTGLANTGVVINATGFFVNAAYIATIAANSATGSLTNTFTVGTAAYFVANGNVGIGDSAPAYRFRVEGNASISGGIHANNSFGTAGQVLHSNGTGIYWAADDTGVSSVATGSGLTGGPITSTGTVSILANTGIVANATGAYVNAAYIATIAANSATGSLTNTFTVGTAAYFVSAGDVGIGTATPSTKLEVRNATAVDTYVRTVHSGATSGYDFGLTSGGDAALFNRNNTNLLLGTNNTERVRVAANGNVGIGTSSPGRILEVNGSASVNGVVVMASSFMRNRIINGDMRIDQRNSGSSVTVTTGGTTRAFPVDRFAINVSGSGGSYSGQRVATAPTGFNNSLQCAVVTADTSLTSTDEYFIYQMIEGFNFADFQFGTASAQTITISFWVRSSLTGSFGFSLKNGTTPPNRTYPTSYTINSANTWEFKTITIPGDTSGTWDTTNGKGAECYWSLGAASGFKTTGNAWASGNFGSATGTVNWISTSGATFNITGVQLEVGSTATPFERRQYGQELALCQRYYYTAAGYDRFPNVHSFKQSMRATPTFSSTPSASYISISTEGFVADGGNDSAYTYRVEAELA